MSKSHTVNLHHGITAYNDMFDHIDGVIRALAKKKTQWKEDLTFTMNFARHKVSIYYAKVTTITGIILISAYIFDVFRKLRSFWKWEKGMVLNPEDDTSYTIPCQEAFLMYVENEYCAKLGCLPVNKPQSIGNNNLFPSVMASRSGQSYYDQYDLSSDVEEYLMPKNVAEMTPG